MDGFVIASDGPLVLAKAGKCQAAVGVGARVFMIDRDDHRKYLDRLLIIYGFKKPGSVVKR